MRAGKGLSRSIQTKLTVTILGVTLVVLGFAFGFVAYSQISAFRHDLVQNGTLVTRVVADYVTADIAFDDDSAATATLNGLAGSPAVEYAILFSQAGERFAIYGSPPEELPIALSRGAQAVFAGKKLVVSEPVADDEERHGTLLVVMSTSALDRRIAATVTTAGVALLVLLLLAYLLARRAQRVISTPILELADVAGRVSRAHDYTLRAPKRGDDEVGALSDAFNHMLQEIQEREQARETADRRSREKSAFLANMSHELRTPLNSILGFSEILATRSADKLAARELRFLQNINSSGQHLLRLVNDILDLSKLEAGRMRLDLETFPAASVAHGVVQMMAGVAQKKNVTIDLSAPDGMPGLEADEIKFKQILYNLLSNALKFSPPGGSVAVSVAHVEKSSLGVPATRVTVRDSGPGIADKDHERVFQEFVQTDTATLVAEGTGLGLTLVKRFGELHAGQVGVESAPGQGATFWVELPQVQARADLPAVLVIETDDGRYAAIERVLKAARLRPLWARDEQEAQRLVREGDPVAIAIDVTQAKPDLWAVLGALAEERRLRSLPLVLLPVAGDRQLGPAVIAADVLTSLGDREQLLERLRKLVPQKDAGETPRRVLVVDDDPSAHELLTVQLEPGMHVSHARSGEEGLAMAQAAPPDVILLDLLMAGLDGFDVAQRLKADVRTVLVPIVVFTAKELTQADRERLRGNVAAMVLKRPGAEKELVAVLEAVASRKERRASSEEDSLN